MDRSKPYVLCYPGSKNPIGNDWGNHTIDGETLKTNLAEAPTLNCGIVLGPGTYVDVECDSEAATAHYAELFAATKTPNWSSARGVHHLHQYDPRLADLPGVIKLQTGLEFRLGNGKQVQSIIPPSIVDDVQRHWIVSMDECKPAPLPEHVIELLLSLPREKRREHRETSGERASEKLVERATQYAAKLPGVKLGERNKTAFANAGHLFAFVDDGTSARLNEQQVLDLIRVWNSKNDPPMSDDELQQCVASAMKSKTPRADKLIEADVDVFSVMRDGDSTDDQSPATIDERNVSPESEANAKYKPFPTHVFPSPIREYVDAAAKAIGCDVSYTALPMLSSLARTLTNKRLIRVKSDWYEPSIVWTVIVGESGDGKSPATREVSRFLKRRQVAILTTNEEALREYETKKKEWKARHSAWETQAKKAALNEQLPPMPEEPTEPICERIYVSDTTVEALMKVLSRQRSGLLISRDELNGWIGSFGEYKKGKSSNDQSHWLKMFDGDELYILRASDNAKGINVPRAAVSIFGGVQPGILAKEISDSHLKSGLVARLLFAWPNDNPIGWSEAAIDAVLVADVEAVFDRLLDIETPEEPVAVSLSPEAQILMREYVIRNRSELAGLSSNMRACWMKLRSYVARFALTFGMLKGEAEIGPESVQAAIELADWFGGEARRVYGLFSKSNDDPFPELTSIIAKHGGTITPRELYHANKRYRPTRVAKAYLDLAVATRKVSLTADGSYQLAT